MVYPKAGGPRDLLKRLNRVMAEAGDGQQRLDKITRLIANSMVAEVCSIYMRRGEDVLELSATEGLKPEAVHRSRLRVGEGLVGQVAKKAEPLATDDAPNTPGFQYLPETGEEAYRSLVGVPIQRLGRVIGVLVVQNAAARVYDEDEIDALGVVAMVIAEMTVSGVLLGDATAEIETVNRGPQYVQAVAAGDGLAIGSVYLHEPKVVVANPIAESEEAERERLAAAITALRGEVDKLVATDALGQSGEHREVLETYRMFAYNEGWVRRLDEAISSGLTAEAAVDKVQSEARARLERAADPYLRERLHDLDDLANRLIRLLLGVENGAPVDIPDDAILVARNIGPGELLDYGKRIKGVVLEEGSSSSHAAIVTRALAIPLVVQAGRVSLDCEPNDQIVLDGDQGTLHLRPDTNVLAAYREKLAMEAQAQAIYDSMRDEPAESSDGVRLSLHMNAGLLADLPSLARSGAEGVGLYRTELQFLIRSSLPRRDAQAALYSRVLDAAEGRPVVFRTLDIGSDKIVPYLPRAEVEENPALGWRALRVALDRPHLLKMQAQALLRGAKGRPISIMFPMVTEADEFLRARDIVLAEVDRMAARGRTPPEKLRIGAMLETPAMAFAPDRFFQQTDFVSVGGNDLAQFFFAADRGNEKVRRRYDGLSLAWLDFLRVIVERCGAAGVPLSYCGEAAGRPAEALALAAIGFRSLSMRPAAIGPVKRLIRFVSLSDVDALLAECKQAGVPSARQPLVQWLRKINAPLGRGFRVSNASGKVKLSLRQPVS